MKALLISADGCTQLVEIPEGLTAYARAIVAPAPVALGGEVVLQRRVQKRTSVRGMCPAVTSSGVELHVFEEQL
jgi:hypothetical protein